MMHHSKLRSALIGALLALLAASCSVDKRGQQQLPNHPIHESHMSDKPLPGYVPTGVWRVKGHSGNVVYLAGTCHTVPDNQLPFPSTYYAAYQQSRDVFFEIDPDSFAVKFMMFRALPSIISFMISHASEMRSPKGLTLSQCLSPNTVKLLRAHYGSMYASKEHFSPLGLLMDHEFMGDENPNQGGVDDLFTLLAHRDHKKITSLDDQSVVKAINPAMEAFIDEARKNIAQNGADAAVKEAILRTDGLTTTWRYGITDREAAKEFASMRNDYLAMYQMLLPQRNNKWIKPITRAIEGTRTTTVFVGAAHLPGPDGLLALLRKENYKPEQMYGIDHPRVTNASAARWPRVGN